MDALLSFPGQSDTPDTPESGITHLDGAEAILTLRAMISNGDFEEYWPFHLAREHQRLYPGTAQGQYTLGA